MTGTPMRVAVLGGHPVIHAIVRLACERLRDADVVGEGATVAGASELLRRTRADVLVLDLELPDGDGIEILRELGASTADRALRVLVISDRDDGATVLEALRLGAVGYLTKADGLRGLGAAVQRVAEGENVLPDGLEARAISELGRYAAATRERARFDALLTSREREVLVLLTDGLTLRQIGRQIGISPRTVETHVGKLYRKMGVTSRVQLVSRAAALGLVDLD
jgi:two-component system, NarL family, response regulator DevR